MDITGSMKPVDDYLRVTISTGPVPRIHLSGELDTDTVPLLSKIFAEALSSSLPAQVELDLADLSFIDAGGVQCLLRCRNLTQDAGAHLILRDPTPSVLGVLDTLGLSVIFDIARQSPAPPPSRCVTGHGSDRDRSARVRGETSGSEVGHPPGDGFTRATGTGTG
nr:STAS domain-containing protein [uncultured Actinoplanes sp.]